MKLPKYNNIDIEKLRILQESTNKSGIYYFTNLKNGKQYIGSSDNLRRRFLQYFNINHLLRYDCMKICRALSKHGYSNFSLEILEYCKVKDILIREKHYIDLFSQKYNISQNPSAPFLDRNHSEEAIQKMSNAKKGDKNPKF
jgi:group I intron endonuclease